MSDHYYQATTATNERRSFRIRIDEEVGRYRSICEEVDEKGAPLPGGKAVAPRFYGVTAAQALRRMIQVLENSYEQIEAISPTHA